MPHAVLSATEMADTTEDGLRATAEAPSRGLLTPEDFIVSGLWTGLRVLPGERFEFRIRLKDAVREQIGRTTSFSAVEAALLSVSVKAVLLGDMSVDELPVTTLVLMSELAVLASVTVPARTDGLQVTIQSVQLGESSIPGFPLHATVSPVPLEPSAPSLVGTVVPGTMATPAVSPSGMVFVPRGGVVAVTSADGKGRYPLQARRRQQAPGGQWAVTAAPPRRPRRSPP